MLCNISGYSIGFGMLSALDTLISQAFGAKEYRQMGLFSQRAMAILTLCCIPIILLWRNGTTFILHHALFIDSETAAMSGIWAKYISFGVWPSFMFEVLKKFLQGQNIIWPIMIATGVGLTCNVGLNHLFLAKWGMGFSAPGMEALIFVMLTLLSLAMTICITQWVTLCTLVTIILIRKLCIRNGLFRSCGLGMRSAVHHPKAAVGGNSTKYKELSSRDEEMSSSDDELDRLESHLEEGVEMVNTMMNKNDIELTNMLMEHVKNSGMEGGAALSRQDTGNLSEKSGVTSVESEDGEDSRFISNSSVCSSGKQSDGSISSKSSLTVSESSKSFPVNPSSDAEKENNELHEDPNDHDDHDDHDDPEDNWPPLSAEIFHEWLPFLALGVPGAVSLFIEWGSFELAAGLAGQLGSTALAVHSIYMQSCAMLYMPPLALAAAASIRK